MQIVIGALALDASKPADLNARLRAGLGCSEAEMTAWLAGNPLAGMVARALHPLLDDAAPAVAELAAAIAEAGARAVAEQVLAVYAPADPAPREEPVPPAETHGDGA